MGKKSFFALVMVWLAMMICSVANAQEIKLKFSNYFPPTHKHSIIGSDFCDEIKKRTNGKVEISYHPAGTLLSPTKMYQGVVTGISDIGFSHIAYTRGRFPVSEVHNLPLGSPSGYISTHVANDFYAKFRPKEWDDVKVLYLHGSNPQILYTASQAVRKLEDVKGLKIRGGGRIADILKSLGANPVPMEFGEVYEAMRRGVLEGVLGPIEMMKGWNTAEVSKYVTDTHEIGSMDLFFCVMNKDKWNSLPEDIKKTFDQVSTEWIERQGRVWNEIDIEAMEYVKSLKREIIPLSENEVKRWRAAVEPVILDYKKDMEVKGVSQSETETYIQFIKERIEFWKKKETEAGVKSAW